MPFLLKLWPTSQKCNLSLDTLTASLYAQETVVNSTYVFESSRLSKESILHPPPQKKLDQKKAKKVLSKCHFLANIS